MFAIKCDVCGVVATAEDVNQKDSSWRAVNVLAGLFAGGWHTVGAYGQLVSNAHSTQHICSKECAITAVLRQLEAIYENRD